MTDAAYRSDPVLEAIRRRRVTRAMTSELLDRHLLETVLDAACWAPTAGNRHLQRYVVSDHPGPCARSGWCHPGWSSVRPP